MHFPPSCLFIAIPLDSKVAQDTGIDSLSSQPPSTTSTLSRGDIVMATSSSTSTNTLELPLSQAKAMSDDGGVTSQSGKASTDNFQLISHVEQIRVRLELLRFLATESHILLTLEQLNLLWHCLIIDTEFEQDSGSCADSDSSAGCSTSTYSSATIEGRNTVFEWFLPTSNSLILPFAADFFQENILKIRPEVLTLAGME